MTITAVNDLDPVFLSYRHSDGDDLAESMAWVLRSHGVPVWHDFTDLDAGRFERRLHEALESGLSGAVLLITPDIEHSTIVRELELPRLLALEADPAFTFVIGSVVADERGVLDYDAPDRFLPQHGELLRGFGQIAVGTPEGRAKVARAVAARRVRRAAADGRLHLDVQTRFPARGTPRAPLAVRTRPPLPGTGIPPAQAWADLAPFLGELPLLAQAAGVRHLHVTGGAHLSVAFALGAAVPTTTGLTVTVTDQFGAEWGAGTAPAVPLSQDDKVAGGTRDDPVAVYLDLVDTPPNTAFLEHVRHRPFARAVEITLAERGTIPAEAGPALVTELRRRIGELCGVRPVHLFPRVPFPVAVLLGRACNTLRVHLHEWERETEPGEYVEVATVSAGRAGGPVVSWVSTG